MNSKAILFSCLLVLAASLAKAQMITDSLHNGVVVVKDERMDLLLKKKAEINKKAGAGNKVSNKGFRIQVLNTTDRNQALAAKSKLLAIYPEHKTYLMYQAPYFKIRLGNFVEKREADALRRELSRMFPTGVFVIPSEIEVKPEKEKEDSK
jgi:hypothetical protein